MVLIVAAAVFVSWKKFSRHQAEIIPVAETQLAQISSPQSAKKLPEQTVAIAKTSTQRISVNTIPVFKPTDEEEIFLQKFDPKLLQNPETEDFIRQRLWLALDQLNNPLMQKLNLSSNEMAEFKNLAVSNLVTATELAEVTAQNPKMFEGDVDAALDLQRQNFDAQLHLLLGDARFAQYQNGIEDYSQFYGIKFLDGNLSPLPNSSVEQIISAMRTERQTVNAAVAQAADGAPLSADDQLQIHELIFGRTYNRVQNFLSPEQFTAFGQFELRQLDLFGAKVSSETGSAQ